MTGRAGVGWSAAYSCLSRRENMSFSRERKHDYSVFLLIWRSITDSVFYVDLLLGYGIGRICVCTEKY